jgi:hypothetical protein
MISMKDILVNEETWKLFFPLYALGFQVSVPEKRADIHNGKEEKRRKNGRKNKNAK